MTGKNKKTLNFKVFQQTARYKRDELRYMKPKFDAANAVAKFVATNAVQAILFISGPTKSTSLRRFKRRFDLEGTKCDCDAIRHRHDG